MPGGLRVVAMAIAVAVLSPAPVRASTATVGTAPARAAVYTAVTAGDISPAVAGDPERVYVPDSGGGTVEVVDPATFAVVVAVSGVWACGGDHAWRNRNAYKGPLVFQSWAQKRPPALR